MPKYSVLGLSTSETHTFIENDRVNEEMWRRGKQFRRLKLTLRQLDMVEFALRLLLEKPSWVKVTFPEAMPERFSPEKWEIFGVLQKIGRLEFSERNEVRTVSSQVELDLPQDEQVFADRKALYKTDVSFGRMGDIEGVYVATDRQVAACEGMDVHLGEVLGKHSEVSFRYESCEPMTRVLTDDPKAVELMEKVFGTPEALDRGQPVTVSGYNPLTTIAEDLYYNSYPEDEDDETAQYDNGLSTAQILALLGYPESDPV